MLAGHVIDDDGDTGKWHPLARQLYDYWLAFHPADGVLPGRQHFDPMKIAAALPSIWLIDVEHDPLRLTYRLVGTKIQEIAGQSLTGRLLDDVHPHLRSEPECANSYLVAARDGVAVWASGKPLFQIEPPHDSTEVLVLPLARDGKTVDMLLGVTIFFKVDGSQY